MTGVREVGADAAPWMAAVHAEGFPAPWDAGSFADLLARPSAFALAQAFDGFVLIERVLDEAEVLTLAVREAARRRGVARALIAAAATRLAAEGVFTLRLEAAEDNPAALGLYAALGFQTIGRRRRYYRREEGEVDARVLALALNRPDGCAYLAVTGTPAGGS